MSSFFNSDFITPRAQNHCSMSFGPRQKSPLSYPICINELFLRVHQVSRRPSQYEVNDVCSRQDRRPQPHIFLHLHQQHMTMAQMGIACIQCQA